MRHTRRMLAGLIAMGLLAGSTVGVAAQGTGDATGTSALATGRFVATLDAVTDFTQVTEAPGSLGERGRIIPGRSEMSDPRLSGEVVIRDDADRWSDGDTFLGDVLWGTVEITNEGGTWTGTTVGITDTTADGAGVSYIELVGSGGYEGLSAIVFHREVLDRATRTSEQTWNAQIFPGALPPGR